MLFLPFTLALAAEPATPSPPIVRMNEVVALQRSSDQPDAPPFEVPAGPYLARFYPARAVEMEVEGRSMLDCELGADGLFTNCRVIEETPADCAFGKAAMRASTRLKLREPEGDARVGGPVRITFNWVFEGGPSSAVAVHDARLSGPQTRRAGPVTSPQSA